MGGSIWQQAWGAAREIFEGLIGDMLGWLIVIAVLTLLVLILYLVLKKMGWHGADGNTRTGVRITLGRKRLGEQALEQMLADPKASIRTIRLDASDPQAQAKLHQIAQLLDSGDPNIQEKLARAFLADAAPNPSTAPPAPAAVALGEGASVPEPSTSSAFSVATSSSPSATQAALPDWHTEQVEKWQPEETDLARQDQTALAQNLQGGRANFSDFLRPVRYAAAGLCATAALLCLLKASRGQPQFNVLALVLALGAVAAWRGFGSSRHD